MGNYLPRILARHAQPLRNSLFGRLRRKRSKAIDMAIQLCGWMAASALKTEKFYDITGSLTFVSLSLFTAATGSAGKLAPRQMLVTGMVNAWASRLGSYLLRRILRDGKDRRFNGVRDNPPKFLVFWAVQGLWVWITAMPVWLVNRSADQPPLGALDAAGAALWAVGLLVEAIADGQKATFKKDPRNKGKFIDSGLWALARHPNYGGEIALWTGVFLASATALRGRELLAAAASPAFVAFLLLKVSGVPLLEHAAAKRWGTDPAYQAYCMRTRLLLPVP